MNDEIFLQLRSELSFFLYNKVNHDEVADIIQEIYLRWRRLDLSGVNNPRAFLFTIALNLVRDKARRQVHVQMHADAVRHQSCGKTADSDPAQRYDDRKRLECLLHALDQLPENVRHAFLLFRFDSLTHAEIARQLGVSSKSVARYIQRASEHCLTALAKFR